MRQRVLAPYRDRVVSSARGRVLEVGIGSALNLPFYASAATEIIGLDPSPKLLEMAIEAARKTPIPLRLIEGTAEAGSRCRCCRDDMDNVQHPQNPKRATADASGTETGRSPFLCRAWAREGAASALVAGSSHSSLEATVASDRAGRVLHRANGRNRLATNSFEAVVMTATVRRHNSDYRDAEAIGHRT